MNKDFCLNIKYNHEFISNKIKDELILHEIWSFNTLELEIINDIKEILGYDIGKNRNVNTLSGGQRSITYLVLLCKIVRDKKITGLKLKLDNILESLSPLSREKILRFIDNYGIEVMQNA